MLGVVLNQCYLLIFTTRQPEIVYGLPGQHRTVRAVAPYSGVMFAMAGPDHRLTGCQCTCTKIFEKGTHHSFAT